MREIKFRGKRIDTGEWIKGNLLKVDEGENKKTCWIIPDSTLFYVIPKNVYCLRFGHEIIQVDPETVCERIIFTDMYDKDVYENDILFDGERNWLLLFDVVLGGWELQHSNMSKFAYHRDVCQCKKVGNIFDNKYLL